LSRENGEIPQEQGLRDEARKFEISPGFHFASEAGIEPFAFVAGRSWQCFWRLFEGVHFRFGNQLWTGTIKCAENLAVISDEKKTFVIFFAVSP
jgi:hypothetical protein